MASTSSKEACRYDVVLSHGAKDKAGVRPLAERLRQDGLKVWFEEWVFKPGDRIPAKIEAGLEHSRLLPLAHQTTSNTHVELIASGLDLFAQHVEKLQDLANKGIHSEVQREGARRALLRTVLLLDDIVALRPERFPINPKMDFSIFGRESEGTN